MAMPDHQDDQPRPTAENRRSVRRRMLKAASVYTKNKHSSANVQLRNLSETGAKLSADMTDLVPDEGYLLLSNESTTRAFVVRWRNAREVGVEFTDEPPQTSSFATPEPVEAPAADAEAQADATPGSVAEEAKRKLREKFAQQGGGTNPSVATQESPVYVTFEKPAAQPEPEAPVRDKSPTREVSEWAARTLGRPPTRAR